MVPASTKGKTMTFQIDAVRARFPALGLTDQGKRRIYLDNPAGTQVPQGRGRGRVEMPARNQRQSRRLLHDDACRAGGGRRGASGDGRFPRRQDPRRGDHRRQHDDADLPHVAHHRPRLCARRRDHRHAHGPRGQCLAMAAACRGPRAHREVPAVRHDRPGRSRRTISRNCSASARDWWRSTTPAT